MSQSRFQRTVTSPSSFPLKRRRQQDYRSYLGSLPDDWSQRGRNTAVEVERACLGREIGVSVVSPGPHQLCFDGPVIHVPSVGACRHVCCCLSRRPLTQCPPGVKSAHSLLRTLNNYTSAHCHNNTGTHTANSAGPGRMCSVGPRLGRRAWRLLIGSGAIFSAGSFTWARVHRLGPSTKRRGG